MTKKDKIIAAIIAFFLGGFGIHKFYLRQNGWGVMYLVLFWTFVPAIISIIEGIYYLFMSKKEFDEEYNSAAV